MLSGKYNPLWHEVDFTNYNTLDSGVFNDVAPLAYKSEVDLVKPYVDNLKPGFIRQEGAYDWRGVSSERTDQYSKDILQNKLMLYLLIVYIELVENLHMKIENLILYLRYTKKID